MDQLTFSPDVSAPVSGRTAAARHASSTGAQAAAPQRGRVTTLLLRAFLRCRQLTIAEASAVTGVKESSVCSVWNRLEQADLIVGTETYQVYQTLSGRTVKREFHVLTRRGEMLARSLQS